MAAPHGALKYARGSVLSVVDGLVFLPVSFTIEGTNDPDGVRGRHYTVTRLDVGKFSVNFPDMNFFFMFAAGAPDLGEDGDDQSNAAHWGLITPNSSTGASAILYTQSPVGTDAEPDNLIVRATLIGVGKGNNITIVA